MTSRIMLVRHGRSAHVLEDRWIDAAGVHRGNTFVLLTASQKGKPPADDEVVSAAVVRVAGASVVDQPAAPRSVEPYRGLGAWVATPGPCVRCGGG